jgi:ribose-phosphate pyrophosphokinase
MKAVLLSLPESDRSRDALSAKLQQQGISAETAMVELRNFPDDETYVRIGTPLSQSSVILFASLDRPDKKILPAVFLAETARELGAREVGLVAPYLPYMRQDRSFLPGEGVTSEYFARLLSSAFDWLVTVDPHLHRRSSLSELYSIPSEAIHAAPRLAEWIRANVDKPLLIGPDSESVQWVSAVASLAGAPFVVLDKQRHGDSDVSVSIPDVARWPGHTPVLVDDIVSTARTMITTVQHLQNTGLRSAVCVAVHAIFAGDAYAKLLAAGAARIVSCNTVMHASNTIDMTEDLSAAVRVTITSGNSS